MLQKCKVKLNCFHISSSGEKVISSIFALVKMVHSVAYEQSRGIIVLLFQSHLGPDYHLRMHETFYLKFVRDNRSELNVCFYGNNRGAICAIATSVPIYPY